MDIKKLLGLATKVKVGVTRGGVWFSVVGLPFIFVREVQRALLDSFGISLQLWIIVTACVVLGIAVCVFDYFYILPRENALIFTNNTAFKKGEYKEQ